MIEQPFSENERTFLNSVAYFMSAKTLIDALEDLNFIEIDEK